MLDTKFDIQARGGTSLLIRILRYDSKLLELKIIVVKSVIKTSTHPTEVSMNDFRVVEIFQAFRDVP